MNAPMPLPEAVRICFPHGGATVSTLRRAIRAGELAAEIIGRQYMVTADDIEQWRETTCRARAKARGSTCASARVQRQSTLSETDRKRLAQGALEQMLMERAKSYGITWGARSAQKRGNGT